MDYLCLRVNCKCMKSSTPSPSLHW
jgi:hypothetical protein